jgi:sulfur carrier protein
LSGFGSNSENSAGMLSFEEGKACPGPDCLDLVVQGKPVHYHGSSDVRSLLESQGENSAYANVRINGRVLSRRDFENVSLRNGDNVDFLYYMGGGACSI